MCGLFSPVSCEHPESTPALCWGEAGRSAALHWRNAGGQEGTGGACGVGEQKWFGADDKMRSKGPKYRSDRLADDYRNMLLAASLHRRCCKSWHQVFVFVLSKGIVDLSWSHIEFSLTRSVASRLRRRASKLEHWKIHRWQNHNQCRCHYCLHHSDRHRNWLNKSSQTLHCTTKWCGCFCSTTRTS